METYVHIYTPDGQVHTEAPSRGGYYNAIEHGAHTYRKGSFQDVTHLHVVLPGASHSAAWAAVTS